MNRAQLYISSIFQISAYMSKTKITIQNVNWSNCKYLITYLKSPLTVIANGFSHKIYCRLRYSFLLLQVCRYAYELMQTYHGDASDRVVSLDIDYFYFENRNHRTFVALIAHTGTIGITMQVIFV